MQNNTSKLNTVLLVVLILLVGFGIWKMSDKNDHDKYQIPVGDTQYEKDNEYSYSVDQKQQQAVWYVSNQNGWVDHTLTWKKYALENGGTFSYPPNYIVKTEKVEIRPDWGSYDEITIVDPNSRSESPDTIYVGVPYTGQSDPSLIYLIKAHLFLYLN